MTEIIHYGRFTIIGTALPDKNGNTKVRARCRCGNERNVLLFALRSGGSQSCGCLQRERSTSHGQSGIPEYHIWAGMINRCENPNDTGFAYYGGRGIKICKRWRESFAAFIADVGLRPSPKYSIDRYPDNDGNYEPGNVRWATATEQNRNKQRNRLITIGDQTLTLSEWAEKAGVSKTTAHGRIARGISPEEALFGIPPTRKDIARNRQSTVLITIGERTLPLTEWAERTGAKPDTIYQRIKRGVSPEEAVSPVLIKTGPKSKA